MKFLIQDFLIAWRTLRRRPAITATAIAMLTLGLASSITMFGLIHGILFEPLPFQDPDHLVMLYEKHAQQSPEWRVTSLRSIEFWQKELAEFLDLEYTRAWHPIFDDGDDLLSLTGAKVSVGYLRLLGTELHCGRHFSEKDSNPGSNPVVILGYGLWQRKFGGDMGLLGTTIPLDDHGQPVAATVIGILKPGVYVRPPLVFEEAEIWTPLRLPLARRNEGQRIYRGVGRLAKLEDLPKVRAGLDITDRELSAEFPRSHSGWEGQVEGIHEAAVAKIRPALRALSVAVLFVFLVSLSNSTLLMMTDQSRRHLDSEIHLALGAGPSNLIWQRFAECFWISLLANGFGLFFAAFLLQSLPRTFLADFPQISAVSVSTQVIGFSLLMTLATTLGIGALRGWCSDSAPAPNLRSKIRLGFHPASSFSPRRYLVQLEVGWSLILLIAAGLMIKSFQQLMHQNTGFDTSRVVTLRLQPSGSFQDEPMQTHHLFQKTVDWVMTRPGVRSAGLINTLPMTNSSMSLKVRASGSNEEPILMEFLGVSAGFFTSLRIPLLKGAIDFREPQHFVALNRKATEQLWPDQNPIGLEIQLDWGHPSPWKVIAVVENVRHRGPGSEELPTVYLPFELAPHHSIYLVARVPVAPTTLASDLRRWSRSQNHPLVLDRIQALDRIVEQTLQHPRRYTFTLSVFAAVSLMLAGSGTYSVVSYSIFSRRLDSSIRLALGASPNDLIRGAVFAGLRDGILGVAAGLTGSLLLTGALSKLLVGVSSMDLSILGGAALLILLMVMAASYLPARALTRLDPTLVVRGQ